MARERRGRPAPRAFRGDGSERNWQPQPQCAKPTPEGASGEVKYVTIRAKGLSGAGFSLRVLVLPRTNPRKLKRAPRRPVTASGLFCRAPKGSSANVYEFTADLARASPRSSHNSAPREQLPGAFAEVPPRTRRNCRRHWL